MSMTFEEKLPTLAKVPVGNRLLKWMYNEGWGYSIILLFSTLSFLCFGMHHLGQFMSVDEPKWVINRVPQLYEALLSINWQMTYINDKPGILPSLLSGITNFFLDHEYYRSNPLIYEQYLFWWRFPVLFFNFIMLFLIYHFTKELLSKDHAIITIILISLNPIIIGISQIVNPDATLWSTSFLSFITFFLYLKSEKDKYIYYSGLFLGLALLSKYFVALFYIIFFIIVYVEYLSNDKLSSFLYSRCISLLKLFVISVLVYTIFFPYTWGDSNQIIKGTFGAGILAPGMFIFILFMFFVFIDTFKLDCKLSSYIKNKFNILDIGIIFFIITSTLIFSILIINKILGNTFFDYNEYTMFIYDRKNADFLQSLLASFYNTLFSLTIANIIIIAIGTIGYLKFRSSKDFKYKLLANSILLTIFIFIFGSAIGGYIADVRYQIILYPLFALLSSIIVIWFFKNITAIVLPLIVACITSVILTMPFYYHYTNILNFKSYVITEAWGFGGYEVAAYLNNKPNAKNTTVWVDREGVIEFFGGRHYWRGRDNPFDEELQIDYLVLTFIGERIFTKAYEHYLQGHRHLYAEVAGEGILKYYREVSPEYIFFINGNPNNYIKVVKFINN